MNKIEIIGKEDCVWCVQTKLLLDNKEIDYEYKTLFDDISLTELRERVPDVKTVPVVFIDEQYIGGYQSLEAYLRREENNGTI